MELKPIPTTALLVATMKMLPSVKRRQIRRTNVPTNEDAFTHKSNKLKTNNANKSDWTTQGCEDTSHHGEENSKLNKERQNTKGGDEDNNVISPVITMHGFRQGFKLKMEGGDDHKPTSKRAKHADDYDRP